MRYLKHRDCMEWEPLLGQMIGPGEIIRPGSADRCTRLLESGRWSEHTAKTAEKAMKGASKPAATKKARFVRAESNPSESVSAPKTKSERKTKTKSRSKTKKTAKSQP